MDAHSLSAGCSNPSSSRNMVIRFDYSRIAWFAFVFTGHSNFSIHTTRNILHKFYYYFEHANPPSIFTVEVSTFMANKKIEV